MDSLSVTKLNEESILFQYKEYINKQTKPIKLYILTPCFGSICYVNYMTSLFNTILLFKTLGIELVVEFCKNESLITRARNNLLAKAMSDPDTTHIMFIDNDISWNPEDITKLIVSDKSLVGGVYPLKKYHWEKATSQNINHSIHSKNISEFNSINTINNEDLIQSRLLNYNVNFLNNVLNIEKNLAKVRHLPTGFMMIKREVIEHMHNEYKDTKYTDDIGFLNSEESKMAYALFDCGIIEGHYFSEDWMFCERWLKIGGEIWINVAIDLTHTGIEDYSGSFLTSLI